MQFSEWRGRYVAVTSDLGYSREDDERAAQVLARLMGQRPTPPAGEEDLARLLAGKTVFVCGASPTLEEELGQARLEGTVLAADGSTPRLVARGTPPDLIVTDLDGDMDAILKANAAGTLTVVHAHGDNIPLIEKFVPLFRGPIIPSVQSEPPAGTRNFGGLTDGDRAAFLADHFGAAEIVLAGFDFGDETLYPISRAKQRKFIWGAMLIASLDNPHVRFFDEPSTLPPAATPSP